MFEKCVSRFFLNLVFLFSNINIEFIKVLFVLKNNGINKWELCVFYYFIVKFLMCIFLFYLFVINIILMKLI